MKTNSLILGAAVLMLATACSNDEVVKVAENGAAIGFSSFVNNSTRADENDLDATNLKDFRVYGVSYRDGVNPFMVFFDAEDENLVSKEVNGDKTTWTYQPPKYWVIGNSYSFAAVAPAGAATVNLTDTPKKVAGSIDNIAFTNNGTTDLLYGVVDVTAGKQATDYNTVQFTLNHLLSRVKFNFSNGLTEGYNIKVVDLKMPGVATSGTYSAEAGTWTVPETESVGLTFDIGNGYIAATGTESASMYLIPTGSKEYKVDFSIELYYGDQLYATYPQEVTLPSIDYVKSYSYVLKANVTKDNLELKPIEFDVKTVQDWENWDSGKSEELPGFKLPAGEENND